jgi:hypothetical protein
MASTWSQHRIKCADYALIHKNVLYKKNKKTAFVQVGELMPKYSKLFPGVTVLKEHFLCRKCHVRYQNMIDKPSSDEPTESQVSTQEFSDNDRAFEDVNQELLEINRSAQVLGVSPVKKPYLVKEVPLTYITRKQQQISEAVKTDTTKKLSHIFRVDIPPQKDVNKSTACSTCALWVSNVTEALDRCSTYNDKVQILTLLPPTLSKTTICSAIPSVTKHMLDKARSTAREKGVYGKPDIYNGHPVKDEDIQLALSFFLDDRWDCTVQSPNKNDTVTIVQNGEKITKIKRYLTRSIKETYNLFIRQYPHSKLGRSKFYMLCPKEVMKQPPKNVCLCVYCENFKLCCVALKIITPGTDITLEIVMKKVKSLVTCRIDNEACLLQECGNCPGLQGLSIETLDLEFLGSDDEVLYAIWEGSRLIKKCVELEVFIEELAKWTLKAVTHQYIKRQQQHEIAGLKAKVHDRQNHLLIHCDFAENWSVVLPNPIQGYHWQNDQVSIFTAVTNQSDQTACFALVSDDTTHDTAHALFAIKAIIAYLKVQPEEITVISDGAAGHFKNRYQLYEISKSETPTEWIFSATGHGKGPCDGVGGLVKHYATKHNLSSGAVQTIQNATDFVNTVKKYTPAINLLKLEKVNVEDFRKDKLNQWKYISPVRGIQKSHIWSYNLQHLSISRIRNCGIRSVDFTQTEESEIPKVDLKNIHRGTFITCIYETEWWVAEVTAVCNEIQEVTVNFMLPHGPASGYRFPEGMQAFHSCSVPARNILCVVDVPFPAGGSARLHRITPRDTERTEQLFSARCS